jgi:hypothetical protein
VNSTSFGPSELVGEVVIGLDNYAGTLRILPRDGCIECREPCRVFQYPAQEMVEAT